MQRCAPRFETLKGIRKKRTGDSQLAMPERLTRLGTELAEITLGLIVAVAVDEQPWTLLPDTVGRAPVNCQGPGRPQRCMRWQATDDRTPTFRGQILQRS